jgi:hypothetical protein
MLRQAPHDEREFMEGTKPKACSFGSMKYTLEIPDQDAEFVLEFLRRVTSVKLTPVGRKAKPKDETEYLLSNPANAKALMDSIERLGRGEGQVHDLIEA